MTFLLRGYGEGILSGSLSLFQYFSFIITIALYATGFAVYASTFIHLPSKVWAVSVVSIFTAINFLGSRTMGRAESAIVIVKLIILATFIVAAFVALTGSDVSRLSPAAWPGPLDVFTGAGVVFVGYEGFGLITNAAANMERPKWELPRAIYGSLAVVIIIYMMVSIGVVTNVPLGILKGLGDSALAVAAKPSLGQAGFRLIAIAALLSTASAVNATLFGQRTLRIRLPRTVVFRLRSIANSGAVMWKASSTRIRGSLSAKRRCLHGERRLPLRVRGGECRTFQDPKSDRCKGWLIVASIAACLALFTVLIYNMIRTAPSSAIALGLTLALSFLVEVAYRRKTGRTFKKILTQINPGAHGGVR